MNDLQFSNVILSDLTDKQKKFVDNASTPSRSLLLTGCAGAGKTLLATMAAIRLNRKDVPAKFIVFTKMLDKFVRDHFKDTKHVNEDLQHTVEYFHMKKSQRMRIWECLRDYDALKKDSDWFSTDKFARSSNRKKSWEEYEIDMTMTKKEIASKVAKKIGINPIGVTFLIDECQDFEENMLIAVQTVSENQIWLGDATQQIFGQAMHESHEGFNKLNNDTTLDRHSLDVNFRNPVTIAVLAQYFITLNKFDSIDLKEKKDNFLKPITRNQTAISGARNQPNLFIHASNSDSQYDAVADRIKAIFAKDDGSDSQIVVTHTHIDNVRQIKSELAKRGIKGEIAIKKYGSRMQDNFDFKDSKLVLFAPAHSLKGLQFDYLFFPDTEEEKIDFNSMFKDNLDDDEWRTGYELNDDEKESIIKNTLFMLFTRAKKRVICSYVNKHDSVVYNRLPSGIEKDTDNFLFINAGENPADQSEDEINRKIDKIKEDFWPVTRDNDNEEFDITDYGAEDVKDEDDEDDALPF